MIQNTVCLDWLARKIATKALACDTRDKLNKLNTIAQTLQLSGEEIEYLAGKLIVRS